MTADQLLGRLDGVKATGDGEWLALCPSHDDRNPSLSIGLGNDERILLNCHAGCTSEEIVGALGLAMADLFADRPNGSEPSRKPKKRAERPPEPLPSETELAGWQQALGANLAALEKARSLRGWSPNALRKLEVGAHGGRLRFPIRVGGELVNVIGYKPAPNDGESKSVALRGRPRGLFPAPESVEGGDVWLVEGEPDAVSAATLGLAGVAVPGVNGWRPEYAQRFQGRFATVCFDCDAPGRKLAAAVSASLEAAGVSHRVVDLDPERSDGFDLGDFLLAAQTVGDARSEVLDLAREAPERPKPAPKTSALLDSVREAIRRFVVLTDAQLDALALWVLHTYTIDAADTTPYLAITSAEKRSGKSRLLEVLAQLVAGPMEAANISDAALFRALGGDGSPVTLLFDEIDAIFGRRQAPSKEELRGLINAGYRRGAKAYRCVGDGAKQEVVAFPVFGPKALAGIGDLPDTIADRSIPIRLRRRSADEPVARGRYKDIRAIADPLKRQVEVWAKGATATLTDAQPDLPDELSDRAQDGAEALLAIADLAGAEWPTRARESLVALHGDAQDEEASWGVKLLADIRAAFEAKDADRLSTQDVLDALKADEEAPWASWGKTGDGLNPRGLSKELKRYAIRPHTIRLDGDDGRTAKGYRREQFTDAFKRYLSPNEPVAVTGVAMAPQSQKSALFDPSQDTAVTDSESASNPHSKADVTDVTDTGANGDSADDATPEEEAEAERLEAKFGETIASGSEEGCCPRPCPLEKPGGGPWSCANCGASLPTPDWVPG